jgi:hypothetical protein
MSYLTDIRGALMSRLPEPFVTAARRRMTVYRGRRARASLAKPSVVLEGDRLLLQELSR